MVPPPLGTARANADAPSRNATGRGTGRANHRVHRGVGNATDTHIDGVNMMCALGVPGNMIHGWFPLGLVDSPVFSAVA